MADDELSTVWGRFKASGLPGTVVAIALFPVAVGLYRTIGGTAALILYASLVLIATFAWFAWDERRERRS